MMRAILEGERGRGGERGTKQSSHLAPSPTLPLLLLGTGGAVGLEGGGGGLLGFLQAAAGVFIEHFLAAAALLAAGFHTAVSAVGLEGTGLDVVVKVGFEDFDQA